ncbi:MAG: alpha-L-rhamnosidase C-terminal domain-containing protein, partial [Mariniphaga sp.]|nr:alpha-L-rhamnosidase C-terminal domain-containing protein [Mariniphaga sp.]
AIGGLRPLENVPAYLKVRIQPQIPEGVTWAKTSRETPYGELVVNWSLTDNRMEMEIVIPVGTVAEVVIPEGVKEYTINDSVSEVTEDKKGIANIQSGKYKIIFTLN